jgi:hypothetical protein
MSNPEGFESLRGEDRRLFLRHKRRAERIAEKHAEQSDDPHAAFDAAYAEFKGGFNSLIGAVAMALLAKVIAHVIWKILQKKFPSIFTGGIPSDLLNRYKNR